MTKIIRTSFLATGGILLAATPALAAFTTDFYTYGGYDAVLSAFQRIASIFADSNFIGLFSVALISGFLFGGMSAYWAAMQKGSVGPLQSWIMAVIVGIVIYLALIVPKGTVIVYDTVKNRFQPVPGVPDGIVILAALTNKIEHGLIDIVSNSGDPQAYQTKAGGIGFNMLLQISVGNNVLNDPLMMASAYKYVQDCVAFEMARPGGTISPNDVAENADMLTVFGNAANPAVPTVYYNAANPQGIVTTCDYAFNQMNSDFTNAGNYTKAMNQRCADSGFDPTVPAEMTQCMSLVQDTTNWVLGFGASMQQVLMQEMMARTVANVLASGNMDLQIRFMGSREVGNSLMSMTIMANDWIPQLRATLTAVAIALTPFLALMLATPLFGRAARITVGFFVWVMAWGVIDAVLHGFAMDAAIKAFQDVHDYQLGLNAILNMQTASMKSLSTFGGMRMAGLMLSSVLVGGFGLMGGHMLGMMAGQVTGPLQGGTNTAAQTLTPEGRAAKINAATEAPSVMANMHQFGFETISGVATDKLVGRTSGDSFVRNTMGSAGYQNLMSNNAIGQSVRFQGEGAAARTDLFGYVSTSEGNAFRMWGDREGQLMQTAALGREFYSGAGYRETQQNISAGRGMSTADVGYARGRGNPMAAEGLIPERAQMDRDGNIIAAQVRGTVTEANRNDIARMSGLNSNSISRGMQFSGTAPMGDPKRGMWSFTGDRKISGVTQGATTIPSLTVKTGSGTRTLSNASVVETGDGTFVVEGVNEKGQWQLMKGKGEYTPGKDGQTGVLDFGKDGVAVSTAERSGTVRDTMTATELKAFASKMPKGRERTTLERMASKLSPGQTAVVEIVKNPNSNDERFGTMRIMSGAEGEKKSFVLSKDGYLNSTMALSDTQTGRINQRHDVDQNVLKRSTEMSTGSILTGIIASNDIKRFTQDFRDLLRGDGVTPEATKVYQDMTISTLLRSSAGISEYVRAELGGRAGANTTESRAAALSKAAKQAGKSSPLGRALSLFANSGIGREARDLSEADILQHSAQLYAKEMHRQFKNPEDRAREMLKFEHDLYKFGENMSQGGKLNRIMDGPEAGNVKKQKAETSNQKHDAGRIAPPANSHEYHDGYRPE